MQIKSPLTLNEQLQKIKQKGFVVDESLETYFLNFLQHNNYYRVSAYFLPFKNILLKNKESVNLSKVVNIYEFDGKLRTLISHTIESIEISLRSELSYYVAHKYGALGYLNSEMFLHRHNESNFKKRIELCISENSKTPVVKHHLDNYGGKFPIWVIIEFFFNRYAFIFL